MSSPMTMERCWFILKKQIRKFKYPSVFTQGFLSFAGEETQTGEMAEFEADQKKKAALEKEIAQLKKSLEKHYGIEVM